MTTECDDTSLCSSDSNLFQNNDSLRDGNGTELYSILSFLPTWLKLQNQNTGIK